MSIRALGLPAWLQYMLLLLWANAVFVVGRDDNFAENNLVVCVYLSTRSVLENTLKMAIVSPLLDLAGFYLPPFYINTEQEVLLQAEDENKQIRVRIDVLVLKEQFWVLVIESKRAEFSLKVGIPQGQSFVYQTSLN